MRASDIAGAIAARLPVLVDDFTDNLGVTALELSGSTVTATTGSAHNLATGDNVTIVGALTPIPCSVARAGILVTITTSKDHDYTESSGATVVVSGAVEPIFNGTFTISSVPNRTTVTYIADDSGPTVSTGSPIVLNGTNPFQSYNGLQAVTATPTTVTFEYEIADTTLFSPASGSITAKTQPRVGTSALFERALETYTSQLAGNAWVFVVINDGVASKNRNIDTDATDNIHRGQFFNQRIIQTASVYVVLPAADQIAGRSSRDRCEELLRPICQSILLDKFDSLLAAGALNPLQFLEHGFEAYNDAYYVHRYSFEATLQMSGGDVFIPDIDVAFRDISMTNRASVGTGIIETEINLDDKP